MPVKVERDEWNTIPVPAACRDADCAIEIVQATRGLMAAHNTTSKHFEAGIEGIDLWLHEQHVAEENPADG